RVRREPCLGVVARIVEEVCIDVGRSEERTAKGTQKKGSDSASQDARAPTLHRPEGESLQTETSVSRIKKHLRKKETLLRTSRRAIEEKREREDAQERDERGGAISPFSIRRGREADDESRNRCRGKWPGVINIEVQKAVLQRCCPARPVVRIVRKILRRRPEEE